MLSNMDVETLMEDNPSTTKYAAVKINVSQSLENSPKKRKQWSTSRLASG